MDYETAEYIGGHLFNPEHLLKLQAQGKFTTFAQSPQQHMAFADAELTDLFFEHDFDGEFDGDYNVVYLICRGTGGLAGGLYLEAHVCGFNPDCGSVGYAANINAAGVVLGWEINHFN